MAAPIGDGYASTGSCGQATTVTTNATTTLETPSRAIYIATDGDLCVTMLWTTASITFTGCLGGSWLPLRVAKVHTCPANTIVLW